MEAGSKEENVHDKRLQEYSFWSYIIPWKFGEKKNSHELSDYGFLQIIFFSWISPLVWYGMKKTIEVEDLGECPPSLKAYQTLNILQKHVILEEQRAGSTINMSFFRIFLKFYYKEMLVIFMVLVINGISDFVLSGIVARSFIEMLEDGTVDETLGKGFLLIFYMGLLLIARAVTKNVGFFLGVRAGMHAKSGFQALIYEKLLKMKRSNNLSAGEMVNLCANDCQRIYECCALLPFLLFFPINIILITTYLYYYFGVASLFGSGLMILYIPLQIILGKVFSKLRSKAVTITDKRVKMISEVLTSIKLIKLYAWEKSFAKIIHDYRKSEKRLIFIMDYVQGFTFAMGFVIISLAPVASILMHTVFEEELSIAKVYTLIGLYNIMSMYLVQGPAGMRALAETFVAMKRIKKLFCQSEYKHVFLNCEDSSNSVEVINANLAWEKIEDASTVKQNLHANSYGTVDVAIKGTSSQKTPENVIVLSPTLHNINLNVKKKSLVGICGSVGVGKSSLVEALLNEMTLTSGNIRITNSIAFVPQQAWIMNATIRENIVFGNEYNEIFFKDVCKACALEEDFKIMPSGDLTEIGERGVNLSGGQKQRVSLARAVYAKKELYLLDDPLSAVDSHVGKHIFENCIKLSLRHHTVLFVTHQLQYLKDCDYVIYMEDGKFTEEGTYDDLMNNNHEFSNIVKKYHNEHKDEKKSNTEELLSQDLVHLSEKEDLKIKEIYIEGEVQLAEEGKIITEEDKVKGSVSLSTYLDFCRFAGGVVPTLAVIMSIAAAVGIQIFAEYCLSQWLSYLEIINDSKMIAVSNTTLANANDKADLYKTLYWAIALSTFSTSAISVFFTVYFVLKASSSLHNTVLEKIFHAPIHFFDTTPVGRIMNRLSKDIDEIDNFLPKNVANCLQTLFRTIGPIIFICIKIPYYTIMAVIQVVFMYLLSIIYRKVVRAVKRIDNVTRSPIYSHITATMQGLVSIRAYRHQNEFRNDFSKYTDTNTNAMFLYFGTTRWFSLYYDFLCIVGVVAVSVAALLLADSISAAILAMSVAYLIKIVDLLQYTCQQVAEAESRFTSVERINHYVNTLEDEGDYETTEKALINSWPSNGVVEFENVSFRYRDNMPLALKDLSFCINDKEKIGIVGRTGAGKSSLSVVLYRLADIEKGSIKISGVDIKDIGLYDLRNSLSMIPQDPVLFIGTIRYNLDPFSKSTDKELWNVLEKAHMKNSILVLPDKLESMVAENGSNFSVGERQLICMARALLRKSKILILDEATAAIDANTDSKIQAMIKEAFCDCTVLTIAHRLNTIMHCDRILLMEKGEILEFDSPSTLLQKDSHFSKMVKAANIKNE